jgi:hypothetical protein
MRAHGGRRALLAASALVVVLVSAGCGSGSGHDSPAAASAGSVELGNTGSTGSHSLRASAADAGHSGAGDVQQRSVISTGQIALTSPDVGATRTRVDAVLGREHGRVADENTTTDDHGHVTRAHLVIRVPSARFDDAMTALAGIATLRSSSRKAEDVTTQVIDVHARIVAGRAGVRRLRHLVSHTADLRALLDVERALTERQAELQSLRQQRAYLADQTSQATITVDVTRRTTPTPVVHAAGGFTGGLRHGWDALVAVVTAVLLALGALLPFAVAVAVLGLPTWLVVRRLRRPRPVSPPAES